MNALLFFVNNESSELEMLSKRDDCDILFVGEKDF